MVWLCSTGSWVLLVLNLLWFHHWCTGQNPVMTHRFSIDPLMKDLFIVNVNILFCIKERHSYAVWIRLFISLVELQLPFDRGRTFSHFHKLNLDLNSWRCFHCGRYRLYMQSCVRVPCLTAATHLVLVYTKQYIVTSGLVSPAFHFSSLHHRTQDDVSACPPDRFHPECITVRYAEALLIPAVLGQTLNSYWLKCSSHLMGGDADSRVQWQ